LALVLAGSGTGLGALPALAQEAEQFAFGPVVELVDGMATVATSTGPVSVRLGADTRYELDSAGSLADVEAGQLVGVTGRPEAGGLSAVEIHVFPALMTVRQAQTPMSGANAGNLMTNARVESFVDGVLTLNLADQLIPINTSAATSVTHPVPVGADTVQEGSRIGVSGPVGADGVLQARVVWIASAR
jgi:hypothetical protein